MHQHRSSLLTLVIVATTLLAVGCASDKQVISNASNAHSQLKPAVLEDAAVGGYLQQIGDRIVAAARKAVSDDPEFAPKANKRGEDTSWMYNDIKFHFVNSKTLNAFTTGGNHVYIYLALFEQCTTEDELAAVVAHEYAHIFCRHVQAGMNRQYTTLAGAAAAGAAGAAVGYSQDKTEGAVQYGTIGAGVGMLVGQYVGMGFTREDEAEADKYGFRLYTRAGWDPNKFGDFFQHMIDAGYDTADASASDHPTLKSRVEWSKKAAAALPETASRNRKPPIADGAKFAQLKERAKTVGKTMPNDESLAQAQQLLAAFSSCVAPVDQPEQRAIKQEVAAEREAKAKAKGTK